MRRPQLFLVVVMVGAALGLFFSSVSTYDFVQHLDRQVHDIHCSFTPGLADEDGESSGCKVTMMSPYSSVFRTRIWGGIPISLPAMSVFTFLLFFGLELVVSGRQRSRHAAMFLLVATGLPLGASAVMGAISFVTLGAACKLCIGIYAASAVGFVGALLHWRRVRGGHEPASTRVKQTPPAATEQDLDPVWLSGIEPAEPTPLERQVREPQAPIAMGYFAAAALAGAMLVVVPVAIYFAAAPDSQKFVGACGALADADDRYGVMVPVGANPGKAAAVEILDPLCPACRAFEERLEASGLDRELDRRVLLFPLDSTCNWMVTESVHPGACVISEAVLCAGDEAGAVLDWAFAEQEAIVRATLENPQAPEDMVKRRFPELATCIGSPEVKSKLNKSMRWAVRNRLQVLTPQLYVDGVKLCDEDVDLGMEFALSRLIRGDLGVTPEKQVVDEDADRAPADRRETHRAPSRPERTVKHQDAPAKAPAADGPKSERESDNPAPSAEPDPMPPEEATPAVKESPVEPKPKVDPGVLPKGDEQ